MSERGSDNEHGSGGDTRVAETRRRLELVGAVLLGLAGVAAAWSSYQAALWGGVQSAEYSRASALRIEASRLDNQAQTQRAVDVSTFSSWIDAYAVGDSVRADFYRARFRPEFRPAFDVWLASRPLQNPDAAATPFTLPEYRLAAEAESEALGRRADETFESGQVANDDGDQYVLNAALLAVVLFLAGIANHFRVVALNKALLLVACVVFFAAVFNITTLPRL